MARPATYVKIVEWFEKAQLDVAEAVLGIVKGVVKRRRMAEQPQPATSPNEWEESKE